MKFYFVAILAILILALSGCVDSVEGSDTIGQIKDNEDTYAGKEVILGGTVSQIVSTVNTPPIAGAKFGTSTFMLSDTTGEIMVKALHAEEIDNALVTNEQVSRYNNQEHTKVTINQGDKLSVTGIVEILDNPDAQETTRITIKASKIQKN